HAARGADVVEAGELLAADAALGLDPDQLVAHAHGALRLEHGALLVVERGQQRLVLACSRGAAHDGTSAASWSTACTGGASPAISGAIARYSIWCWWSRERPRKASATTRSSKWPPPPARTSTTAPGSAAAIASRRRSATCPWAPRIRSAKRTLRS